uniref:Protein-serine O-palmitoleoyltransferase porcupine n=1 Tax=Culex pipiens TaxID=7175 RepID=A0A8D8AAM3_CULPI
MSDCLYDAYDDSEDYYDTQYEDLQELDLTGYEDEQLEWSDLYQSCVLPSFLQISAYILPFIGANILLCCCLKLQSRYAPAKGFIAHILSSGVGIYLLYSTMQSGHLYVILLLISIYLLLKASFIWQSCRLRFDYIISIYAVLYLILCEIIEEDRGAWHHARGVLMIAVMKAISLAFDTRADARLKDAFSILSFLGYICCPANCIFGPWTSFGEYLTVQTKQKSHFSINLRYFAQILINLVVSISCVLLSNCTDASLFFGHPWKWVSAYGSAFSFRTSHYFISFLSQATMVSYGFTGIKNTAPKSPTDRYVSYFGYVVVRPLSIEIPRSLVDVVVVWNIPMHIFLKQYVFRVVKPSGTFTALFVTYMVSSLLHGLNFQLWAVLLTLGLWSYVEYNIRKKLAAIFSACVLVNKCSTSCSKHKVGKTKVLSILINTIFFILCVINLAYLGFILEGDNGFSLVDALKKWQSLDYTTHWLALVGLVFYYII